MSYEIDIDKVVEKMEKDGYTYEKIREEITCINQEEILKKAWEREQCLWEY